MSQLVIVDTDVWSLLFARRGRKDVRISEWRALLLGSTVAIATQTRAEVLTGVLERRLGERESDMIISQLDRIATIPVSEDVVKAYAALSVATKAVGHALWRKEHTGDRWIAASANAVGAPLLSGDAIFRGTPTLTLLDSDEDS